MLVLVLVLLLLLLLLLALLPWLRSAAGRLLLLHLLLHHCLLLSSPLLQVLDELGDRHAGLLRVNGDLSLHGRHLLRRGHLPGARLLLHGRPIDDDLW